MNWQCDTYRRPCRILLALVIVDFSCYYFIYQITFWQHSSSARTSWTTSRFCAVCVLAAVPTPDTRTPIRSEKNRSLLLSLTLNSGFKAHRSSLIAASIQLSFGFNRDVESNDDDDDDNNNNNNNNDSSKHPNDYDCCYYRFYVCICGSTRLGCLQMYVCGPGWRRKNEDDAIWFFRFRFETQFDALHSIIFKRT